jgi:hypothetical protein
MHMINATELRRPKQHHFTFREALAASEKVGWRVEDIIGGDKRLDFTRPFMPETFARVEKLAFLTPDQRRVLNQIRGYAYLNIFGIVEEFIVPFVLDHVRQRLRGDDYRMRAFLTFADEEAKHIHLFNTFRQEFERGFGSSSAVIGPSEEIGKAVLSHDPLAVALAILQIEWMTQRHYLDSVKDDQTLDPLFKSLLRHHWQEEAQHAKLDTLMVDALAATYSQSEVDKAVGEYLEIGGMLDGGLRQQTEFDLEGLTRATGRELTPSEHDQFIEVQHQANRWTYLGSGMTHPNFLATLELLGSGSRERIEQIAPAFC